MTFIVSFLLSVALSSHGAEVPKPKYGPASGPKAVPLAFDHQYFQNPKNKAPDFWSLIGFYVPQRDDYSCSAATVAMVLNGAKALAPGKTADTEVVTQDALLDKVKVESWAARLSEPGLNGVHGTSLKVLSKITAAALKEYGFPKGSVLAVHVDKTDRKIKEKVVRDLAANEASSRDFIMVNFNQKAFTDDADVGHFAVIGAFDKARSRVLILDPDRRYYEPYWVSVDTLIDGMSTSDSEGKKNRGYLYIKLN